MVPHRQGALASMGREVGLEPLLLRRTHRCGDPVVVAVQYDDVPRADVVAVIAPGGGVAGGGAEIAEIPRGAGARVVVAVAGRGERARLVSPPAGIVAALVLRRRAVGVRGVAQGEDRPGNRVEQESGGVGAGRAAAGDVAGADERGGCGDWRGQGGARPGGRGAAAITCRGDGED